MVRCDLSKRTSLVLRDDQPGLVEQLAAPAFAAGANWEESRTARLSGVGARWAAAR
jgi:glycine cleavage system regulatory protein